MEDSAIIDLFFERSEQAVAELEQKYGAAVRKTAGNLLRDRQDAEECANDTYLRVWNSIPPQRPDFLGSFICRITRNLAVSMLRAKTAAKRNRELDLVLDELEACIPSPFNVEADYELKNLQRRSTVFSRVFRTSTVFCSSGGIGTPIPSVISPRKCRYPKTVSPCVFSASVRNYGRLCKRRACLHETGKSVPGDRRY